ncbi:DNA helicase UvrD [Haloarcula sp. CBA1130]|uniref:UvrD-helicase domain-containing protein n=1 Tax=Haloarcula sp. CBA1130 TaxID=1853685 RepID=UPI00124635C2|nr:UvrD-helicase domain-containing protein [Haloarcula sp. CBA1130]KAA9395794.1 DNA helicase UvrD [Haloarcula sp. CBA1129]KAA9400274.1 DNA helicase UvrD [Haloarcula sp. CBA1130]
MSRNTVTDEQPQNEYIRLDGAQREIRDEFFENESGLFIQMSDPGTGKSTTTEFIAAEYLIRASLDGVDAPEERLAFISFTRDDAASIGPGIAEALETLARDPTVECEMSVEAAQTLGRRVQHASNIGTVDSFLGSIFQSIAAEVGFSEGPTVGENSELQRVRAECLDRLRDSPRYAAHLERLTEAYPGDGAYQDDAGAVLRKAQLACRERQLSVPAFQQQLETIVEETYPTGRPASFADIRMAVEQFVDEEAAAAYEQRVDDQRKSDIVASDRSLFESWSTAIADLCSLLEAYVDVYDDVTRERAVASHLDAAHWVARFFTDDTFESRFRSRLQHRYTDQLSVIVVDEAQDVSTVQSAALSPLVDQNTRVLLAGDLKQLIFLWRNAQPALFRTAIDDGRYFGIDWETHCVEYEHQTRRCRPDIAAAVDAIFRDVFTDSARGATETVTQSYSKLEPTREQTATPNVHIGAFSTTASPGSADYIAPDRGTGEADILASCIADGLASGRFTDDAEPDTDPTVTVLFHQRTNLQAYTHAFERVGLSVGNATEDLFTHPLVKFIVEVCTALSHPDLEAELRSLLRGTDSESVFSETVISGTKIPAVFELYGPSLSAIVEQTDGDRPPVAFAHGIDNLVAQKATLEAGSPTTVIEAIITELDLWSDPLDLSENPTQRVTALDALLTYVGQLESDSSNSLERLVGKLKQVYANPKRGPKLPLASEQDYDVVFKTIFQMKGDEDDVIALGDIGQHIGKMGPHVDTFSAQGSTVALAPPKSETTAATPALSGFEHGIYTIDCRPWDYDAGLRWVSQRWAADDCLAGSPPLSTLAHAHRAGRWRLLYVALTRARDHVVIPLPEQREQPAPRDYWIDTLREGLDFDATVPDTYTCNTPAGEEIPIQVHRDTADNAEVSESESLTPAITTVPAEQPPPWTPRYVNPSTLFPLLDDPNTHILDHLQSRPLQTQHEGISDEIDLTLETAGLEDIGEISHHVIATAMRHRGSIETDTLRQCEGVVGRSLEYELAKRPSLSDEEQRQIESFISETVCPQFAQSELWAQIQTAADVYVEESVQLLLRIDGLETEVKGTPDVIFRQADSHWETAEIKIIFQDNDAATQDRHTLQAQIYAWALSKQLADETTIGARLTQLGVKQREKRLPWDKETLTTRLSQIRSLV